MSNISFEELRQYSKQLFDQQRATMYGADGEPGLSAYDIAVQEGFVGTKQEWLDSLKGKSAYEAAVEAGFTGTEQEFNNMLTTPPKGAYELAVENGFVGTEQEWLDQLAASGGGDSPGDIKQSTNPNTDTEGFLPCDGQKYLQSEYPELFDKVGLIVDGFKESNIISATPTIEGTVFGLDFNHDGSLLAVGHLSGNYHKIIDTSTWSVVNTGTSISSLSLCCQFSPDGSVVAFGDGNFIRVFNTSDWSLVTIEEPSYMYKPRRIVFSPDGSKCFVGIQGGINSDAENLVVYDTSTWNLISTPTMLYPRQVQSIAVSNDGTKLVVGGHVSGGGLKMYNISDWSEIPIPRVFNKGTVSSLAFSPDDSKLFIGENSTSGNRLVCIDTSTMSEIDPNYTSNNYIWDIAFSANGSFIALAGDNFGVTLLDYPSMKPVESHYNVIADCNVVTFSPSSDNVAFGNVVSPRLFILNGYSYDVSTEFVTPSEKTKIYNSDTVKAYIKKEQ